MQAKMERMKELHKILQEAAKAYYQESREIMSNFEYDRLYDELVALEEETGVVLAGSPTVQVGYQVLSELPKETHGSPMLSLDKTKEVGRLQEFLGEHPGVLSWKLDGLTVVLTYQDGKLFKAVTRGNGEIGEVVTENAKSFRNVPMTIPFKGELVLRGEAVIRYSDFEKMNALIGDEEAKYKNPRNLCAGSVRQLNSKITAERNVNFFAFSLVSAEGVDFKDSRKEQFVWLSTLGFDVVEYKEVTAENLPAAVGDFANALQDHDIPSDGLVLLLEEIAYGESLGRTAKFPRNAIAFKWADEQAETTLSYVEWSASRTGLINPVAVFESVELEGTTVSRASLHNISYMKGLELGLGDRITVYKANMIIPQIADNLTRSGKMEIPAECPVCGGATKVQRDGDVEMLYCTNPSCQAKKVKSFALLASRDALNIDGLSEATLEKFIAAGLIHEFADIFRLKEHREAIAAMEGFGEKSADNLIAAADTARDTQMYRFVYSLGIPGIGVANAKVLCKKLHLSPEHLMDVTREELLSVEGIGEVLADGYLEYFTKEENVTAAKNLMAELNLELAEEIGADAPFTGMTFVITGSVEHFANRSEMKNYIEERGGKVTGSVTAKTTFLINNDIASTSGKNKKAKELGIPILTEEELLRRA